MSEPQPEPNERNEWYLSLQAMPGSGDPIARLKAALKRLRRSYGLRCTGLRPAVTTEESGVSE